MKKFAYLLFALTTFSGCVGPEPEDGPYDSFLTSGKADTGGIVDGSPDALAVLQVANDRSAEEMHDHGVPQHAADNIVAVRVGDDGIAGTSDDVTYASLAQLDAVPYVGPIAFARLLAYANELNGSAASNPTITPPADLWNVAPCTPVDWSQLAAMFASGETNHDIHIPFATASRFRESCNSVTGCTHWLANVDGGLWVHEEPGQPRYVTVPQATRGVLDLNLDPGTTAIGFTATSQGNPNDFFFNCRGASQSLPTPTAWTCSIYGDPSGAGANFTSDSFQYGPATLAGQVCADGSYHFTTTLLNDDSSSLQNLVQVAFYGRLF